MDAIAGGKNNKAKQDNEAEPDIDEDSLIPDSPMFRMYLEELEAVSYTHLYFAVDASKVTPIPKEMSYEEGAMIEPLAVAVHGVKPVSYTHLSAWKC